MPNKNYGFDFEEGELSRNQTDKTTDEEHQSVSDSIISNEDIEKYGVDKPKRIIIRGVLKQDAEG